MEKYFDYDPVLFEPTISILKNGLLINYKKVGTRYFNELSSLPNDINSDRKQIDLIIRKDDGLEDSHLPKDVYNYTKLDYRFDQYHVYTQFDMNNYFSYNTDIAGFSSFKSTPEMFDYLNCKNYNELFFENKDRDIVFIVRNPIKRLISGITQILYASFEFFSTDENLRNELKYYSKLNDDNIKNVIKYTNTNNLYHLEHKLEHDSLLKMLIFISEKKWDWILQDIHTQNYLHNFLEMMSYIKDKTRIKIIDLEQTRSQKSLEFFNLLRGDCVLNDKWEYLSSRQESNKIVYDTFYKNYIKNKDVRYQSSLFMFLRDECRIYNDLINSPYFIDLKD